jgi:hypothetical protein
VAQTRDEGGAPGDEGRVIDRAARRPRDLDKLAKEVLGEDATLEVEEAGGMVTVRAVAGNASRAVSVPAGPSAEADARKTLHVLLLREHGRLAREREGMDEIMASAERTHGRHPAR